MCIHQEKLIRDALNNLSEEELKAVTQILIEVLRSKHEALEK